MREKIVEAGECIVRFTHNLAALLLAIASIMVFLQVVTRFVFNDPAAWTEIIARSAVIWLVFLVSAAGFRYAVMIPLEFIRNVLPDAIRRQVMVLVTVLVLMFLGILIWYGIQMTLRVRAQQVALLDISMAWFYAAIPVGALCAVPGVLLGHFRPRQYDGGSIE
ncbi:TRAP transporter small permease [Castellaniella sp. S9]|uniref:TRAP transporter small permease n=1 Tax=Castellaniella sp. S9 TaxID=2993652 RepID=UPI0022B2BD58|nr:TRAP transporter small permease [Castellaniella sp. S9]